MRDAVRRAALLALACWAMALAAAAQGFERVELRVTGLRPGGLVAVDRGEADGLAVGDLVLFRPREGGTHAGNVVSLEPRTALVEMHDRQVHLALGTRGEVEVPAARLVAEEEPPAEAPPEPAPEAPPERGDGTGEAPPPEPPSEPVTWPDDDAGFRSDQPLLARVRPVRPAERAPEVSGRLVLSGEGTLTTLDERTDSFWRAGGDVRVENPFGAGGSLHVDAEANLRTTDLPDRAGENFTKLRLDRFSWAWGGTRWEARRFEAGRFLQRGMVEFGVLDGAEWSWRRRNGDGFGFSAGFLPEPDPDFSTGDDFQLAAWYRWLLDPVEHLTVGAGYQKSWHHGDADRDLLVARLEYAPPDAWNLFATGWIDYYGSSDRVKGTSLDLTQALVLATRRWEDGSGVNVSLTHQRIPEIERNEFPPIEDEQLEDDHDDRLSLSGWRMAGEHRVHGALGGWVDEEDEGGDLELGVDFADLVGDRSHSDVTGFVSYGHFSRRLGGQIRWSRWVADGSWDLFYELALDTIEDFADDADDVVHHRLRLARDLHDLAGWHASLSAEVRTFDDEGSLTLGFYLQRGF